LGGCAYHPGKAPIRAPPDDIYHGERPRSGLIRRDPFYHEMAV